MFGEVGLLSHNNKLEEIYLGFLVMQTNELFHYQSIALWPANSAKVGLEQGNKSNSISICASAKDIDDYRYLFLKWQINHRLDINRDKWYNNLLFYDYNLFL